MKIKKLFGLVVILALILTAVPAAAGIPAPVTVQILALNDFHGALDPSLTKPGNTTDETKWYYRGGAEYLANFVNAAVATNPNTLKVSAGDMIGATPLLSALFHDEPTVMAFNLMGFDFSNTGNHEFDEGWQELLRTAPNRIDVVLTGHTHLQIPKMLVGSTLLVQPYRWASHVAEVTLGVEHGSGRWAVTASGSCRRNWAMSA